MDPITRNFFVKIGAILGDVSRIPDTVDEHRTTSAGRRKKSSIFVALGRGTMTQFAKEEENFECDHLGMEQGNTISLFHLDSLEAVSAFRAKKTKSNIPKQRIFQTEYFKQDFRSGIIACYILLKTSIFCIMF